MVDEIDLQNLDDRLAATTLLALSPFAKRKLETFVHLGPLVGCPHIGDASQPVATLVDAEKFAVIASLYYDWNPNLDKAWRLLLFGQHHDALTGSDTENVNLDLLTQWRESLTISTAVRNQALALVAADSQLVREIEQHLADMYYVQGIEAQLADELEGAFDAFAISLQWQPGHAASTRKLRELADRADAIYAAAVAVVRSDPDLARRRLELVTRLVPNASSLARMARQQLAALR